MKPLFKGLDTETQLLVALGSAVASGCIPCLENMAGMALAEGIDEKKMRAAAITGQQHEGLRRPASGNPSAIGNRPGRLSNGIGKDSGCSGSG